MISKLILILRPLAAGFLTGNVVNNEHTGTRFSDDNPIGKMAQKLFGAVTSILP